MLAAALQPQPVYSVQSTDVELDVAVTPRWPPRVKQKNWRQEQSFNKTQQPDRGCFACILATTEYSMYKRWNQGTVAISYRKGGAFHSVGNSMSKVIGSPSLHSQSGDLRLNIQPLTTSLDDFVAEPAGRVSETRDRVVCT